MVKIPANVHYFLIVFQSKKKESPNCGTLNNKIIAAVNYLETENSDLDCNLSDSITFKI